MHSGLFPSLGWLQDVVRNNFVTIARQLESIPHDVLAASHIYIASVAAVESADDEIKKELCAVVTSHFASLGKISAMPAMAYIHQVFLGRCLSSPLSCTILLCYILNSPVYESYLPQHFVKNMLQEQGIGTTSLVQLCSAFHEQKTGEQSYLVMIIKYFIPVSLLLVRETQCGGISLSFQSAHLCFYLTMKCY